ncbi:3141_t:CDS:10 [Ambispora leptoticha]|uniref:Calcium-channel protein CCH1 n=1 Tax=Ambispora leptoticha TaxID=144679 RepID=A0A9N9BMP3_9GLOM|nr:3141_t:CDS:10 [Ambispora leptoticha]
MENKEQISENPLIIQETNNSSASENINIASTTGSSNRSPRLSPTVSTEFDEHIRRRARSSSRNDVTPERSRIVHRSHTVTHPASREQPTSNSPWIEELDRGTMTENEPKKMQSFLNRRRTIMSGNDAVEMSSMHRESFATESEFNPYTENDVDDYENIDDSDTAQLTAISSERPKEKAVSLIEPRNNPEYIDDRIGSLRHTRSLGRMSQMLARASSRVVNLHNIPQEVLQRSDIDLDSVKHPIRSSNKSNEHNSSTWSSELLWNHNLAARRSKETFEGKQSVIIVPRVESPLVGRSLYIFGPTNPLRVMLYRILNHPWAESIILLLIVLNVILLVAQAWVPVDYGGRETGWGTSWTDYGLLVIFVIYTFEITARIIVSGFIINPKSKNSLEATHEINNPFKGVQELPSYLLSHVVKSKQSLSTAPDTSVHDLNRKRNVTQNTQSNFQRSMTASAFLRHTFNRIDLLAVVSFWIDFGLSFSGVQHFYLFKALGAFRSLRLLSLTSGSSTILQSLKKSLPLLVNVAFFVLFFFNLFSIIAVQSFKGSFMRHCMWIDPNQPTNNYSLSSFCGGYIDNKTLDAVPYLDADLNPVGTRAKGYLCPRGQICLESGNPHNGTVNFDNVFSSMILVFVISSVQSWSDLMYDTMDSDFYQACIFFIVEALVLNFWLINLFVAVITEMFAKIREDSSHSAFTLSKTTPVLLDDAEGWTLQEGNKMVKINWLTRFMNETKYLWIIAIIIDLIIMAFRTSTLDDAGLAVLSRAELVFTILFAIEIILRFGASLPDYRHFFHYKKNVTDFVLVVITCLIQIPEIKHSSAYPYLTVFQIMRVYRVIIAWTRLRNLLMRVLGSAFGLANLVFFILLVNFISAVIGVQLIRGDIPSVDENGNQIEMRFSDIYNSFVALYQVFSGENWTTVLYDIMSYESAWHSSIIGALFLLTWFSLSNFVLLNMFIAILEENFETAEEEKRKHQLKAFIQKADPKEKQEDIIDTWNIYRFFKAKPKALAVENIPSNLILSTQKSRVKEFLNDYNMESKRNSKLHRRRTENGFMRRLQQFLRHGDEDDEEYIALTDRRRSSEMDNSQGPMGTNDLKNDTMNMNNDRVVEIELDELQERRAIKADFIAAHPNYDESLWFLSPRNRIRHYCQLLVPPSYGERLFGTAPSPTLSLLFSIIIFLCIVASFIVAAITNPAYQKRYFEQTGTEKRITWFWIVDTVFTGIFTIEFLVKIIADGFLLTPNAYLLNIWNVLDFFVLGSFYINLFATLFHATNISRSVRVFKALRALRLINLSSSIKETFYAILIAGFPRILDASLLSISLIIPFAIYGQNVFSGLLYSCNDSAPSIVSKDNCTGEFQSSPYLWTVLAPRVWNNPYVWSFDNFRSALLILFEILSGEGWIDVMTSVMAITGRDKSPSQDASKWNALFFMIFNMAGAVFVLTLFINVIIENYKRRSGSAFLTADQKRWIDLKKLLKQTRPSKRPKVRPQNRIRAFCYDRAIEKKGWLSRFMTVIYILHILNLMTEFQNSPPWLDTVREDAFLVFIAIYIIDICIKLAGFGWKVFRENRWNLFDVFVVSGAALTTIPMNINVAQGAVIQLQKLFLVAIALKLIQKSDSLNQLFKTMAASLPSIFDLFAVWFVVFCVYSIMFMEIFGLTKYGIQATRYVNFRDFSNAFLTLIRMSTGEGWNTIMHDYTVEAPYCVDSHDFLNSDCGSRAWAYVLFITWNVLSMYIFSSMFIVVVIDNFSYCYQIAAEFSLKAWAAIDVDRTGYIKSKDFAKFFGKLSGSFEVKIYEDNFQISNLLKNSLKNEDGSDAGMISSSKRYWDGDTSSHKIDIIRLQKNLSELNLPKIHERRRIYNCLYQEALITVEKDSKGNEKGISFANMLIMLAHYKLIDDDKSLRIDELLKRKEKMEKVIDHVNKDRVKSLLRTIYWRRKFKAQKEMLNAAARASAGTVPRITVNDDSNDPQPLRIATNTAYLSLSTQHGANQRNSPISPPSPRTPNSASTDLLDYYNHSERNSADYAGRTYEEDVGGELLSSGWRSIDANNEMDDQTADLVLDTLQSNIWHDVLQEVTEENSRSNQE